MTRSEALDVRMTGLETEMRKVRSEINLNFEVMSKRMAELFEAMCHKLDKLPADATSPPTGGSGTGNGALMESRRQESPRNLSEELLEEKGSQRESLRSDDARVEDTNSGRDVQIPGCLSDEVIGEIQTEEAAGGNSVDDGNLQQKEVALQIGSNRVDWGGEGSERRNPGGFFKDVKIGREIDHEELAGAIQKAAMDAAREQKARNALWVLGLSWDRKFEPVFILDIQTGEFGSDLVEEPKLLGPPPWRSYSLEKKEPSILILKEINTKENCEASLVLVGLIIQPNLSPEALKHMMTGLTFESLSPPPPWPEAANEGFREAAYVMDCLQPRCHLIDCEHKGCFVQPIRLPEKPPPHPPDFVLESSRLEISSSIPATENCHTTSLHISSRTYSASEDPGDPLPFLLFLLPFNSKHSLEVKAILKGSARGWIFTIRRRVVEDWVRIAPPPAKPPWSLFHACTRAAVMAWFSQSGNHPKQTKIGDGARDDFRGNQLSTKRLSQLTGASWETYVDGLYLVLHPALFIAQLSHFVNAATSIFYHSPRPPDACSYIQP